MVHARRSPSDHRYLEWGIKHDANQIQFARGGIAAGVVDENIPLVACCLAGGSVYAFRGENTNEEFTVKKQTTPVELHRNYASWSNEDGGGECSIDGFCAGSCLTFCENYEDNMTARGSCNKTKNRRHKPIPLLVVAATGGALDVFACATKFGRKEDDSKNIFHKLLLDGTVHQLFVLLQSGRSGSAKWNLAAKVCEGLDGHDVASQILSNNQLQPIRDLILDIANGGANS